MPIVRPDQSSGGGGGGGAVNSVTATDTSVVVGGTPADPTLATATLDVIAADHPPAASWSNNSKKITALANGSAASDAAAFGQIPTALPPSGAAGGDLTGTYPNPTIVALAVTAAKIALATITDAQVAAANKDGAAGTASLRTLGTGAAQATAGNDARLSDSRTPSGAAGGALDGTYPNPGLNATVAGNGLAEAADVLSVNVDGSTLEINADALRVKALGITDAQVAAVNKDGAAGTASMRTLGTGAAQATAGNDSRLSDARTPTGAAGGVLSGTYPNPGYATTPAVPAIVDVFTASGTWTKRSGLTAIAVVAIGGGGGGGGGRRGAAASARFGGGGAAGASAVSGSYAAGDLGATETVTIGAGGSAGAAASVNDTDGGAGGTGGNTTFGSWLQGISGLAGGAGTATSGPSGGTSGTGGGLAGGASSTSATAGTGGTSSGLGAAGGGGGGGIDTGNTTRAGGAGGTSQTSARAGGAGGAAGGGAGGGSPTNNASSKPLASAGGGGGGSGDTGGTVAGGAGGTGAAWGGGAGGGGASTNGANSGAGGVGGAGIIVVLNYF